MEDEEAHLELIRRAFAPRGDVTLAIARSLREARRRIAESPPDLVVADLVLPDGRGVELLAGDRQQRDWPVIVTTAHGDEQAAVEAMRGGALDYVVKSAVTLADLPRTVDRALREWDHIAARRRAEQEAASLARFPAENPHPVLRIAAGGKVLYANAAATPVLSAWGCRLGQELAPEHFEPIRQVLESGCRQEAELTCEGRTFALTFAPVADAGYVNVYGRDVTQRQHLQEQLRQAQKVEAIGRLAAGVAHDFNNLLTPILGYAEQLLARPGLAADQSECLEQIARAARRAKDLTRQLLAFGRRQVLRVEVADLNEIVSGAAKMLRRLVGENIELVFRPGPRLPCVRADRSQLEQVLMNLVINAGDAMPRGGRVSIQTSNAEPDEAWARTCPTVRPGRYVVLAVRDTGCGMDAGTVQRVFEPFFTTKPEGRGTGLGLATVHGIVKQHAGEVVVHSEVGKGSTFKVYLPAAGQGGAEGAEPAARVDPRGEETVLVVEDDPSVRRLVCGVLSGKGYRVLVAGKPAEALALAERHDGPIHLLLTDVILPGINGRELHRRLGLRRPQAKALYMSGHVHDVIVHHGVLDAGIHFLQKPFAVRALAAKVREVLDG